MGKGTQERLGARIAWLELALREKVEDYRSELANSARLGEQVRELQEENARLRLVVRRMVGET